MDFYRRYYVPNNTVLAIVGDIDKTAYQKSGRSDYSARGREPQNLTLPHVPVPLSSDRSRSSDLSRAQGASQYLHRSRRNRAQATLIITRCW